MNRNFNLSRATVLVAVLLLLASGVFARAASLAGNIPELSFGLTPRMQNSGNPAMTHGGVLADGSCCGKLLYINISAGLFVPIDIKTTVDPKDAVGTPEDPIDFENALGVSPDDIIFFPEVTAVLFGKFTFRARYELSLAQGEQILKDNIVFDGTNFSVGDEVKAELEDTQTKFFLEYNVINTCKAGMGLWLSAGIGANLAETRQFIEDVNDASKTGEIAEYKTFPLVAAQADIQMVFLDLTGRVEGMEVDGSRNWEATGGVNFLLPPRSVKLLPLRGGLFAGYRYYMLDIEDTGDLDKSKVEKSGPVLKLQLEIDL